MISYYVWLSMFTDNDFSICVSNKLVLTSSHVPRWSLPEIKDCLQEAGFQSVHFWLRQMPDSEENRTTEGFGVSRDIKYEEVRNFEQEDSWNAYIIAVVK